MYSIDDKKYKHIVKPILRNENFKKTYNIEHHGISRMEHSLKVSYYSYLIAKKLKFDYEAVARGGLLHDFYLDGDQRCSKDKFLDVFINPKKALLTSKKFFELSPIHLVLYLEILVLPPKSIKMYSKLAFSLNSFCIS